METITSDKNICEKILSHLLAKTDCKDDLDGLLLAIYENEIEELSMEILRNVSFLVTKGILIEYKNQEGKNWFKLSNSEKEILDFMSNN